MQAESQTVVAFWELGMGNWELVHKVFLPRFDAPLKIGKLVS